MELGSSIDNKVIEDKIAQLNPGHCASIIYTVRDIRINTHSIIIINIVIEDVALKLYKTCITICLDCHY